MSEQVNAYTHLVERLRIDADFRLTTPKDGPDITRWFVEIGESKYGPYDSPTKAIVGTIKTLLLLLRQTSDHLEQADQALESFLQGQLKEIGR